MPKDVELLLSEFLLQILAFYHPLPPILNLLPFNFFIFDLLNVFLDFAKYPLLLIFNCQPVVYQLEFCLCLKSLLQALQLKQFQDFADDRIYVHLPGLAEP